MARKSRGVHVFFVFTKIALNKPLVPYGFRGPLYLLFCFRTSRRHIKTGIKTHFFYILLVWETALCLLMDIILWRNSFAVLPYGDFNLIVRETLWKIYGRLHRVEVILNRDFLEISSIASAFPLALSSMGSGGPLFKTSAGMLIFSSSASSNNAEHDRLFVLKLIKRC